MSAHRVFEHNNPMLKWLGKAFEEGARTVLDIGGAVGTYYYSCRKHLTLPGALRWRTVEAPEVAFVGRTLAVENMAEGLYFTSKLAEALSSDRSDVWISTGATRYFGHLHPATLLQRAKARPKHILVNNLWLHWDADLIAMQYLGQGSFLPMHVYNRASFIRSVEEMGYLLCDAWEAQAGLKENSCYPSCACASLAGLYFLRHQRVRYE